MPHVIVKMYPGRTEDQKRQLAEAIERDLVAIAGSSGRSISIAIEEVGADQWAERVYRPDILNCPGTLYKKPGYDPFA
jgi:4-oxalocrotonate tautomerase